MVATLPGQQPRDVSSCEILSSLAATRDCLMVLAGREGKNHFLDSSKTFDLETLHKSSLSFVPVQILKETLLFPLSTMARYDALFCCHREMTDFCEKA